MISLRQSPRRSRRLLALMLPLVLLRLLIPAGFMPVAGAGGLAVGLCPGEAAMPPGYRGAHAGHQHHAERHGEGGAPGGEHHAQCLFAASAVPAFTPTALATAAAPASAAQMRLPAQSRTVTIASIERAQSPRAPPTPV
jgi:hypothetical protein